MAPSTRRHPKVELQDDPTRCNARTGNSWYPCLNPKGKCRVHGHLPQHISGFLPFMTLADAQNFCKKAASWFIDFQKLTDLTRMLDQVMVQRINHLEHVVEITPPHPSLLFILVTLGECYKKGMNLAAFDIFTIMARVANRHWHPTCIAAMFDTRDNVLHQVMTIRASANNLVFEFC